MVVHLSVRHRMVTDQGHIRRLFVYSLLGVVNETLTKGYDVTLETQKRTERIRPSLCFKFVVDWTSIT